MRNPHFFHYLSHRIIVFILLNLLVFTAGSIFLTVHVLSGDLPRVELLISVLILLSLTLLFLFWIIKPYLHNEKIMLHMLDGYFTKENFGEEEVTISPSSERFLRQTQKNMSNTQFIELNKRQAQYLALQNQINPHFLYNTLESIRSEALIAGLDSVADMTEALARFFRYTISNVENLVSVEEELQNCETYFQIQQYRFGSRLKLTIDYDHDDWNEILRCHIPKLTLQPILENSIIHGTELKIGAGNIRIRFECTENRLIIRISDDGIGMDDQTLLKLNKKLGRSETRVAYHSQSSEGGIALVNVNNRIKLLFGEEYGLHVYSVPQYGTDVDISLPLDTEIDRVEKAALRS